MNKTVCMIFKFRKIEIWRIFLVGVPIHLAVPIHPDLQYPIFGFYFVKRVFVLHHHFITLDSASLSFSRHFDCYTISLLSRLSYGHSSSLNGLQPFDWRLLTLLPVKLMFLLPSESSIPLYVAWIDYGFISLFRMNTPGRGSKKALYCVESGVCMETIILCI